MDLKIENAFCEAASLGVIAGMRTFMAPAVISHLYSRHPSAKLAHTPFKFIQSISTSKVLKVLAAGEMIGDKLPNTPNRTSLPGLIGRTLTGAFAGAAVYKANGKKAFIGGIVGGGAAVAATFGCFILRKTLSKNTILPDPIVGVIEDALVIAAGASLIKSAHLPS